MQTTLSDVFMDQMQEHMAALPACEMVLRRSRGVLTARIGDWLIMVNMGRDNELQITVYVPNSTKVIDRAYAVETWASDPGFAAAVVSEITAGCR